jgi:hypothetical protein
MNLVAYLQRTSYVLSLLALTGVLALLWFQKIPGTSADFLVPAILGVYISGESAKKISAHIAATKDPNCSTGDIIMQLEGKAFTGSSSAAPSATPANSSADGSQAS